MSRTTPGDRYEPLPPVYRLPKWLWARMGAPGRALVVVVGVVIVTAVAVAAPRLARINQDNRAAERREAAADRAALLRRVRAEQRPRTAVAAAAGPASLLGALKARILADIRARPGSNPVRRVECRSPDRAGARARRYACTAVTSDVVSANGGRGFVGYPYRAVVRSRQRRLTWCKVAGSAGEGSFNPRNRTPIPRACGG